MQHTLATSTIIKGIGLHSGKQVTMTLRPAEADHGIVFVRTDLAGDNRIPARWDAVVDTRLCTVIGNDAGASIGTIEHLMAALRGCGIDNALIDIDGPEVPILDGSSAPFVAKIDQTGTRVQPAPRRAIKILREVSVEQDGKIARLLPGIGSTFSAGIEFAHPSIGRQDLAIRLVNGNFRHDIAEARTFGFAREVEMMRRNGLALGGSLDNAIVLDDAGVLNPDGLRFNNEFIRHKLLDAIGDLYLAGGPILGAYEADRPGHAMNNLLLRKLFATKGAWMFVDQFIEDEGTPVTVQQRRASAVAIA